jgi:hypothetical protein
MVEWPGIAAELGFRPSACGAHVRNGSRLDHDGAWLALSLREPFGGDPLREFLGAPGLWRGLREESRVARVFDLPPLVRLDDEFSDVGCAVAALVSWAEATVGGARPEANGLCPEEVEGWIAPARRRVRAGSQAAQVEVATGPGHLALAIPVLVRIPPQLPAERSAWLAELIHDAQARWRMVRFGIDEAAACVRAEVDLSGAPADLARPLVELGLAALTCCATWLLPSLALAADPSVCSRALSLPPGSVEDRPNHKRGTK